MDPGRQSQELLTVSASMRSALLVYSGITVKMMIDSDLGAQLSTMFMVQYDARKGVIGGHDHPLEETYLILEGEVDATFDGEPYHLVPGDVAWAGVGCVHAFANPGRRAGPVAGDAVARSHPRATRTGSSATGTTCGTRSRQHRGRFDDGRCGRGGRRDGGSGQGGGAPLRPGGPRGGDHRA